MYNASATKHAPTIRNAVRSTSSRRENVQVVLESPEQCRARRDFDQAIQTEPYQRHRTSDQPGNDGCHAFEAVVTDGEVFQAPAAVHVLFTICRTGRCHASIMRDLKPLASANGPLLCETSNNDDTAHTVCTFPQSSP
jgi:hypothetical protein